MLADGKTRLRYKCNGLMALTVTVLGFLVLWFHGWVRAADIIPHIPGMAFGACVVAFIVSSLCFLGAMRVDALPAVPGNSGDVWYDFYLGRELNPRPLGFDIKFFCELRTGLFLWVVLNLVYLLAEVEQRGSASLAMILVNAGQLWYVADALYMEPAVLTTMDMTTEGFGFMLALGNLAWVPFTYSLQARYLSSRPYELSAPLAAALVALHLVGYAIFRLSNLQKTRFRSLPAGHVFAREAPGGAAAASPASHLFTTDATQLLSMKTKRGTNLITSGWWGVSRHVNYLGDWLMALSWCAAAGAGGGIAPWFYTVFFATLLLHREIRDEEACQRKYGPDWIEYKKRVPYRIIPHLY